MIGPAGNFIARGIGSGGKGWTPRKLDLSAWWCASDAGVQDGAKITSLPDRTGHDHTLAEGSASAQPTYSESAGNGRGGLVYAGGQRLTTTAPIVTVTGPWAIWVIALSASTTIQRFAVSQAALNIADGFGLCRTATTPVRAVVHEGVGTLTDGSAVNATVELWLAEKVGASPIDLTNLYVDGTQEALTPAAATCKASTGPFRLGQRTNGTGSWSGTIFEAGIKSGLMTSDEKAALAAYAERYQ